MKPYFISMLEQRWIVRNKDKLSVDSNFIALLCIFFLQNNSLSLGKHMSNQYHHHMSVLLISHFNLLMENHSFIYIISIILREKLCSFRYRLLVIHSSMIYGQSAMMLFYTRTWSLRQIEVEIMKCEL